MSGKTIDLTGQRFSRWIVLKYAGGNERGASRWKCRCDCGTAKIVSGRHLRNGCSKSCGCYMREQARERGLLPKGEAASNQILTRYKQQAKERGFSFRLSKKSFRALVQQNCVYCGAKPSNISKGFSKRSGDFIYSGIDRVNSSKGYVSGNVVACCEWCNRMKLDHTAKEFLEHVTRIVEYQKSK